MADSPLDTMVDILQDLMDPSNCWILIAVVVITTALVVYFAFAGQRTFEEAYSEDARKLLNQDKEKTKPKVKPIKKKDNKDKKQIRPEPVLADAPVVQDTAEVPPIEENVIDNTPQTSKQADKKKNIKTQKIAPVSVAAPVVAHDNDFETSNTTDSIQNLSPADDGFTGNAPIQASSEAEGKGKKARKQNKKKDDSVNSSASHESVESDEKWETVAHVNASASKSQSGTSISKQSHKKEFDIVDVVHLDCNKVITRLSTLEDLAPEYYDFIVQYFSASEIKLDAQRKLLDQAAKEQRLRDDINQATKNAVEKKERDLLLGQSLLQDKFNVLAAEDNANKSKISKLTSEYNTLKSSSDRATAEYNKMRSDYDKIKQESTHAADKITALESELGSLTMVVAESDSASSRATNQYNNLEKSVRQLQADLESSVSRVKELTAVLRERDETIRRLTADKEAYLHEREEMNTALSASHAIVGTLNNNISELDTLKKELIEREARISELEKIDISEITKTFQTENSTLKATIEELSLKITEASAAHSIEASSLRAQLAAKSQEDDEVAVLQKAVTVDAALVSTEELDLVKEENRKLLEKNEELRRRNFKILDDVNTLEKAVADRLASKDETSNKLEKKLVAEANTSTSAEERGFVVNLIGSLVDAKSLNANASVKEYESWLRDVAAAIQANIIKANKAAQSANISSVIPSKDLQIQVDGYRSALACVKEELLQIESLTAAKSIQYEARIEQLEKRLASANKSVMTVQRLKSEHLECKLLKEQISSLRDTLKSGAEPTGVSPVPTSASMRSEESDWEVVN